MPISDEQKGPIQGKLIRLSETKCVSSRIFENQRGGVEMDKNFAPGKYGMVICPLCDGKGFLIKNSEGTGVSVRKVCVKCGGFGAIKREEKVFRSLGIKSN